MSIFKRILRERFWRKLAKGLDSDEPERDRDDDRYDPFKDKGPYRGWWFGPKYGGRR